MRKKFLGFIGLTIAAAALFSGCAGNPSAQVSSTLAESTQAGSATPENEKLTKITLGTYNGTCEAPLYVGIENGIFKKYGFDVSLVNINANTLKEGLASGKIQGAQISAGMFKAIEQGLDIKLTDGIHTGCVEAVVPKGSPIQSVKDLKGKTVGIDSIGGVPQVLLSIDLGKAGVNPKTDVQWRVYPQAQLEQAMEKGEIDAFGAWDPYGALAVKSGKAVKIFGNGEKDTYCCYVGINGTFAQKNPDVAKKLTDAWAEADEWVEKNPDKAAKIAVDKKYISSGDEIENSKLLGDYKFGSDKKKAKSDFTSTLQAMKTQGILDSSTDVDKMVQSVFID